MLQRKEIKKAKKGHPWQILTIDNKIKALKQVFCFPKNLIP
jgi:hypothetical protein